MLRNEIKNNKACPAKLKRSGGFSLLELILAVAIFSLGAVAMATLMIDSNISTKLSLERTEALNYAKEGIEAVRSIRDNVAWVDFTDDAHGLDNSGGSWVFSGASDFIDSSSGDDDKYERTVNITASTTLIKDVSVTIEWDLTPSRTATVVLETILTNWGNK